MRPKADWHRTPTPTQPEGMIFWCCPFEVIGINITKLLIAWNMLCRCFVIFLLVFCSLHTMKHKNQSKTGLDPMPPNGCVYISNTLFVLCCMHWQIPSGWRRTQPYPFLINSEMYYFVICRQRETGENGCGMFAYACWANANVNLTPAVISANNRHQRAQALLLYCMRNIRRQTTVTTTTTTRMALLQSAAQSKRIS